MFLDHLWESEATQGKFLGHFGLYWVTALTTDGQFVSLTPHARKKSRKNRALRVLIFYAV
jgi:hypothetical protein